MRQLLLAAALGAGVVMWKAPTICWADDKPATEKPADSSDKKDADKDKAATDKPADSKPADSGDKKDADKDKTATDKPADSKPADPDKKTDEKK